jgi:phage tail-like protein
VLTNLEDRIGSAHLLSDPRTVPEESLEWLAAWIGVSFDASLPSERRRRMVAEAPRLFRERGTLAGLKRALDVATGGACSGGEIVVVEDWRLRRTFATILGADLADEDDPLLGGLAVSGNSFVGDTLLLGEEHRKEFLALFGADLEVSGDEAAAIAEFFGRLAHRVTVLVHQEVEPQDLGLIRRVVELEKPAHVAAEVVKAEHSFRVGLASLVAVDSYLRPPPEPRWVHVEQSVLGSGDLLLSAASLDPRLSSSRAPVVAAEAVRPRAVVRAAPRVQVGAPIVLDGTLSRPGPERQIAEFAWQWLR